MSSAKSIACVMLMASVYAGTAFAQNAALSSGQPYGDPYTDKDVRGMLDRYCVSCHSARLKTAGLILEALPASNVGQNQEIWEKVLGKLRHGTMPPVGAPRPNTDSYAKASVWLSSALDQAAALKPNPGRTEAFHRLNRAEYQNAVRDLLDLKIDMAALLPPDDTSNGFDNMAGVQRMSPTLMDRYTTAAQQISQLAIAARGKAQTSKLFRIAPDNPQNDQRDGLPLGTRGGMRVSFLFPVDGTYQIRARVGREIFGDAITPFNTEQQLEVSIDGERVHVFTMAAGARRRPGTPGSTNPAPRTDSDWNVNIPVKAGQREVSFAWLNRVPSLAENRLQPFLRPYPGGGNFYTTRNGLYLATAEIDGPIADAGATGAGQTPSRRRILICQPRNAVEEPACANRILTQLARRGYRRPVTSSDVQPLLSLYRAGAKDGGFEAGIQRAIQGLLLMPEFLYRIERDPVGVPVGSNYQVSQMNLASRLSFFLWSSIPDEALLTLAAQGKLNQPQVLDAQVKRMLSDPRADAFINNFAGQWLLLRNIGALNPDIKKVPDFDDGLRQSFRKETELFFESIVREDRNVIELLTADYTFVNERLAKHYGIPEISGDHFRRVHVADERRRGILGHGSVLSLTAYPDRTSPVVRGKWVLDNLLGSPPPEPPPNVPALKDSDSSKPMTVRERLALHRASPACAGCHAVMDPIGFGMENYDQVGQWRTFDDRSLPIDSSGVMLGGVKFDGITELRSILVKQPDLIVGTLSEKLLAYALGRGVEYSDQAAVRKLVREASLNNYRFSSIVTGIVKSLPFQMRRVSPVSSTPAGGVL